jgi:hypothetical protein
MATMSAMALVHEEMHERAGQDQQVWQDPKHMSPMLRQEEETADEEEAAGNNAGLGSPEARLRPLGVLVRGSAMIRMIE